RPDFFDPRRTSPLWARLAYYFSLLGGLYAAELFSPLLFLLPRRLLHGLSARLAAGGSVAGATVAAVAASRRVAEVRAGAAAALCYGRYAWLLLAALLLRALLISFLDLVYHYGSPPQGPQQGYDLRLPRVGEC